jgi:bifunctional oligoribonuclease and PAP phosphatase NrnA
MQALIQLKSHLDQPKHIAITHHYNSDYDALGSTLGLKHYLETLGHTCTLISPNANADYFKWMPGINDVLVYEENKEETQQVLDAADILFCLDFNIFHRTKHLAPLLEAFDKTNVLIDHHLDPDLASFDYGTSIPEKSSTAEMVYDFIQEMEHDAYLDKNIATCLYIGTVADTGGFRYPSTTANTMRMAARLMETGINTAHIQERAFDTKTEANLRILGYVLNENMQIFHNEHSALIYISKEIYKKYNIKPGGTEGLVNVPLGIGNIIFSTFMVEYDDEVKISLRSQGNLDVSKISREHFNGGGHKNAAGGRTEISLEDTISIYKTILETNKKEIETCYNELQSAL